MTYSKAHNEAMKRYLKKERKLDPFKARGKEYKSKAKTFINKYATLEELKEIEILIKERKEELK